MWVNAQHDGRPAEYRWRPLFNAQCLADADCLSTAQYRCQEAKPVEISWGAPNYWTDLSRQQAEVHHIMTCRRDIAA